MSPQITFADWSGGEYGDLGPTGAKDNMFTGSNVMVFKDGTVGPRPGIVQTAIVGTSTATGMLWACRGIGSSDGNHKVVIGQGQLVKRITPLTPSAGFLTTGTVSITVTVTTQVVQTSTSQAVIPIYGSNVYVTDGTNPPTGLASAPGAAVAIPYGSRLMVANAPGAANRVYYTNAITTSAIANATFGATNFFDVGFGAWPITHLDETRQRLTIPNQGGDFWGLSGTPGVNDVLRRQPRGDVAPIKWYQATRVGEGIWFLPFNEDFPVSYTGAITNKLQYKYLRYTGGNGLEHFVTSLPAYEAVLIYEVGGNNRALQLANNIWSYHTFGVTTRFATPLTVGGPGSDYDGPLLLTDGGSDAGSPSFYFYDPALDRPGKTSDLFAQPGDNSTTPLTASMSTRYWWTPNDKDVQVTEITIDGFTWNTGSASTNHLDVQVRSLFRFGDVPYTDSVVQSFDQPASMTTADKQDARFRATNPGAPWCQGVQIILSNMRGFALRRIRVQYKEGPSR